LRRTRRPHGELGRRDRDRLSLRLRRPRHRRAFRQFRRAAGTGRFFDRARLMAFSAREVLIPLVGSGEAGALCRVAADGHLPPQHPAHLDRSISELLEGGLYQAGQQARAAVRRLQLGGWLRRPAPVAVSIVNPGDVAGLAPDNSASAELGLALAMLMFTTQSPNRIVIASGALESGSADLDCPIRPVHHLRAKFVLVEKYF